MKKELRDLLVKIIDQKQLSGNDVMMIIEGLMEKNCKEECKHVITTYPPQTNNPIINPCVNPWEGYKVYCNEDNTTLKTGTSTVADVGYTYNSGCKCSKDKKENAYDPFIKKVINNEK